MVGPEGKYPKQASWTKPKLKIDAIYVNKSNFINWFTADEYECWLISFSEDVRKKYLETPAMMES